MKHANTLSIILRFRTSNKSVIKEKLKTCEYLCRAAVSYSSGGPKVSAGAEDDIGNALECVPEGSERLSRFMPWYRCSIQGWSTMVCYSVEFGSHHNNSRLGYFSYDRLRDGDEVRTGEPLHYRGPFLDTECPNERRISSGSFDNSVFFSPSIVWEENFEYCVVMGRENPVVVSSAYGLKSWVGLDSIISNKSSIFDFVCLELVLRL